MKHLKTILGMALVASSAFVATSCSDDDDDAINRCDRKDCEILQGMFNEMGITVDSDPTKWPGVRWTVMVNPDGIRRVRSLSLTVEEGSHQIPENIADLSYLQALYLKGGGISGTLPESLCVLGQLDTLCITNTSMTSLPDNTFNGRMKYVQITGNLQMSCTLPSSITFLKGINKDEKMGRLNQSFLIDTNGFTGEIPAMSGVNILIARNDFTAYDYSNAFTATQSMKDDDTEEIWGVAAPVNRLGGEVPASVLADTLASIHFAYLVRPNRQKGTGFTNFYSRQELVKMAAEFYANHPEYKNLTKLLSETSF